MRPGYTRALYISYLRAVRRVASKNSLVPKALASNLALLKWYIHPPRFFFHLFAAFFGSFLLFTLHFCVSNSYPT